MLRLPRLLDGNECIGVGVRCLVCFAPYSCGVATESQYGEKDETYGVVQYWYIVSKHQPYYVVLEKGSSLM